MEELFTLEGAIEGLALRGLSMRLSSMCNRGRRQVYLTLVSGRAFMNPTTGFVALFNSARAGFATEPSTGTCPTGPSTPPSPGVGWIGCTSRLVSTPGSSAVALETNAGRPAIPSLS